MTLSTITNAAIPPGGTGGHVGPVLASGGTDLYVVAEDIGTADKVGMFKSTNGGTTWTRQDTGNAPVLPNNLMALSMWLDGDLIHIVGVDEAQTAGMAFAQIFEYYTFDVSTDLWGIDEQITTTTLSGISQENNSVDIAVRSDGDVIVAHQISDRANMGNDYTQAGYSRREGGTWTTEVEFFGENNSHAVFDIHSVMAPNDEFHVQYSSGRAQTLDAANVLSTRVNGNINTARLVTWDNGGTQQILGARSTVVNNTARRYQEDGSGDIALDLTSEVVSSGDNDQVFRDSVAYDPQDDIAHVFWFDADADLHHATASQGTGFGGIEELATTTGNASWAQYYERDGARQIGYLVLNGSTLQFDEVALAAAAPVYPPWPRRHRVQARL